MGLIQTPDQLRFSYLAVLEGAKYIMGDPSVQVLEQYTRPVVFPVFVFVQLGGFFFFLFNLATTTCPHRRLCLVWFDYLTYKLKQKLLMSKFVFGYLSSSFINN